MGRQNKKLIKNLEKDLENKLATIQRIADHG